MKKTQGCTVSKKQSFTILDDAGWNNIPMFCPICDFVMENYSDHDHYKNYDCCKRCFLKFVEFRKKKWLEGWRPTKEEIDSYKDSIRCHPPSFILS